MERKITPIYEMGKQMASDFHSWLEADPHNIIEILERAGFGKNFNNGFEYMTKVNKITPIQIMGIVYTELIRKAQEDGEISPVEIAHFDIGGES